LNPAAQRRAAGFLHYGAAQDLRNEIVGQQRAKVIESAIVATIPSGAD